VLEKGFSFWQLNHLINFIASFCSFSNAARSRNSERQPPLNALRADIALPLGVFAPVDLSHGFRFMLLCKAQHKSWIKDYMAVKLSIFNPSNKSCGCPFMNPSYSLIAK
jgi:hypothetical protein